MTREITRAEWDRLMKKPGFDPGAYIIEGREPRYKIVDEDQIASLDEHDHDMRDCGDEVYRCVLCTRELEVIEGEKDE